MRLVPEKIDRLVAIITGLPNELAVEIRPRPIQGKTIVLDASLDDEYIALVESTQVNPTMKKDDFKIVFSPQHGTSYQIAMRIFKDTGYHVFPVMSQCDPDPDFKGTLSPNPEDPRAYIEAIAIAKKEHAHLIVMNDPDADRVGVAHLSSK